MILTDKEIESLKEEYEGILQVKWHPTVYYLLDATAKAQLKKDAEYLEKYVFYVDARGYIALKPHATKNYQAFIKQSILEEVKE